MQDYARAQLAFDTSTLDPEVALDGLIELVKPVVASPAAAQSH
jgi:hypothetical protein